VRVGLKKRVCVWGASERGGGGGGGLGGREPPPGSGVLKELLCELFSRGVEGGEEGITRPQWRGQCGRAAAACALCACCAAGYARDCTGSPVCF
jgi:hypothetical protein